MDDPLMFHNIHLRFMVFLMTIMTTKMMAMKRKRERPSFLWMWF